MALALPWAPVGYCADELARAVMTDARKGNCIICHAIPLPDTPTEAFGNVGPSLAGIGSRLTRAQIRERIVDPRLFFPESVMPAYGSTAGLHRVLAAYRGKPILTDQEIDAVAAYLSTLK